MLGLLAAAVAGGVVGYYWRDTIREYLTRRAPDLRDRTAERLGSLGERAGGALERARSRIETTVRAGQERLRARGDHPHENEGEGSRSADRAYREGVRRHVESGGSGAAARDAEQALRGPEAADLRRAEDSAREGRTNR